ncbi:hypothetical protein GYB62_03095 [bacterium]|nr:hypothetical protein [bacterium]
MMPLIIKSLPFLQQWYTNKHHTGQAPPSGDNSGKMTRSEAMAILGLSGSPNKDAIIEAHRKLVQKVHPDRGGSEFLTTQLNQARDTLLS